VTPVAPKLMDNDPETWIRIFNPMVNSFPADKEGRRMLKMWIDDIKLQNDTKPKGFHTFHCPVHVFVALKNWMFDSPEVVKQMNSEQREWHQKRCAILTSKEGSQALWDHEAYEEWAAGTSESCDIHDVDADHNMLKAHKGFLDPLWKILGQLKVTQL